MKNTAGEAKRRGRKAPMSVPFFLESKAKRLALQKRETEVSPRLTNFVLQMYKTINLAAKVANLPLLAKRSEEKRDRPHHWVQCQQSTGR